MRPDWGYYGTYDESAHPDLWNGVVGYWAPCLGPTGLRLHDVSRSNNWGTLNNFDAAADWALSDGRFALTGDGTNNTISLARAVTLDLPFSVSIWLRFTSTNIMIMFTGSSNQANMYTVTGTIRIGYSGAGVAEVVGPSINTDKWVHVIGVWDSATYRAIYVDGKLAASDTDSSTGTLNMSTLLAEGSIRRYIGLLDDLSVWNRALSPNDAARLYQLGRGGMLQRRSRRRAYSMQAGFRAHYATQRNAQLIGGGLR